MLTLAEPARDLWDRFHREPSRTRFDDPLLSRWARSRALGALSGTLPAPVPRPANGGGSSLILGRSDPLLADAAIELSRRGCALVLADREGCILKAHGVEAIEDHAVRAGLARATGDYVLIQDADMEYDLEDYDALLEPLISGREAFTLGARHGGAAWKMRQFTGQPLLSLLLNAGHWFFTTMVNVLFLQRLKDPFTMFKVFRRDCIYGLNFKCNRFDFDYELLIKLLRKGYKPLELPVNYRSRSFEEGKKVSMVSDPLSWIKACFKLRFEKIDPMAEVESRRTQKAGGGAVAHQ